MCHAGNACLTNPIIHKEEEMGLLWLQEKIIIEQIDSGCEGPGTYTQSF